MTTIDGPSADIASLGQVAISEDGSGGVVYLKRVGGRVHVFAAQFVNDHWLPPQQVDLGQKFDSLWPTIGAGDGGRLVVVWAQPYAANVDRLYFSALDPGATTFQTPHVVDPNIGLAKYVYPSVSMNRGGQALLVYRVVTNDQAGGGLPAGYVTGDIRLARFDGSWWSVSGTPLERNVDQPQRTPTALNSPQVGIGLDGNGVVAWQEPDDNLYDRIWARRIFGSTVSNALEVSPTTYGTTAKPPALNANADALALHVTDFDAAAVAIRQQPPADGKAFTRARVYVNQMPNEFDPAAGAFEGARVTDGAGLNGPTGAVGMVGIGSAGDGTFDLAFGVDNSSLNASGAEDHVSAPARLDQGSTSVPGNPRVARGDNDGANFIWTLSQGGAGGIGVLERDPDGTPTQNILSADTGGDIHATALAGSDFGDSILGFLQGDGTNQTIDVATINVPPGVFNVATPPTWVNTKRLLLDWDPAPHGMTPVTYTVLIDDQDVVDGLRRTSFRLSPSQAPDGVHAVSVSAIDPLLQETDSATAKLLIDRTAPRLSLAVNRRRRRATIRASDGPRGQVSGVADGSTVVHWGDGRTSFGTRALAHTYRRGGAYTVRVSATDNAGNTRRLKRKVRV